MILIQGPGCDKDGNKVAENVSVSIADLQALKNVCLSLAAKNIQAATQLKSNRRAENIADARRIHSQLAEILSPAELEKIKNLT